MRGFGDSGGQVHAMARGVGDETAARVCAACNAGGREYLKSTRGAAACGAAVVVEFGDGVRFEVECSDNTTIHFSTMEI
jgi:hypothetical protein